jgi:hypothetical protein
MMIAPAPYFWHFSILSIVSVIPADAIIIGDLSVSPTNLVVRFATKGLLVYNPVMKIKIP